jgi:hypothetical protein
MFDLAAQSHQLWLEVLDASKIPYKNTGSLHIACNKEEEAVGKEFAKIGPPHGYECAWLDRDAALAQSTELNPKAKGSKSKAREHKYFLDDS